MKMLALRQFDGATHRGRMSHLDIGIEKQNVGALGLSGTKVAADRGHSAADDAHVQAVAETQHNFRSTVGRVGISHQHSRTRHLRVVLLGQRSQQTRNQFRLVLGRNHDRQFARDIRAR